MRKLKAIIATSAAIAAGLGIGAAAMAADELHAFPIVLPTIVVSAGLVHGNIAGVASGTEGPPVQVSVDYRVSYADLDLTKSADVKTLNRRVQGAEHDACHQLNRLFPRDVELGLQSCMSDVQRTVSQQERQAIAAALSWAG